MPITQARCSEVLWAGGLLSVGMLFQCSPATRESQLLADGRSWRMEGSDQGLREV